MSFSHHRPGLRLIVPALLVAFLMAATTAAGSSAHTGAGSPLVVVMPSVVTSFDPAVFQGSQQDYAYTSVASPLLRYKPLPKGQKTVQGPNQIEGELAQSWTRNANGSYTFTLRAAKSPAGNTVTSQDVLWSFQRLFAVAGVEKYLGGVADINTKNPVKIISPQKFTVEVTKPNSLLLPMLTYWGFGILDSATIKANATAKDPWGQKYLATHSATFGPYQLSSINSGNQVTLTANPNYWGLSHGMASISSIVLKSVPDSATRLLLVKSGSAGFDTSASWDSFASLKSDSSVSVSSSLSPFIDYVTVLDTTKPFDDVRIREAISMAIDRKTLVQAAYAGFGEPALSPIIPVLPQPPLSAAAKKYTTYNPTAAKALLAQAGYGSGLTMTIQTNDFTGPGANADEVGSQLKSQLAAVGINATIDPIASENDFVNGLFKQKFATTVLNTSSLVGDPAYWLFNNFSSMGNHISGYDNPKLDSLVEAAVATQPGAKRNAQLTEMQNIMGHDLPWIPLVQEATPWVFRSTVTGAAPIPLGVPYFQDMKQS